MGVHLSALARKNCWNTNSRMSYEKIPSEMKVAPHYKLLHLLTLITLFTLLHFGAKRLLWIIFSSCSRFTSSLIMVSVVVQWTPDTIIELEGTNHGCKDKICEIEFWFFSSFPHRSPCTLIMSNPLILFLFFICHSKSIRRILVEARQNIYLLLKFVPC